jgi:acetylornithine/N-succinyldiaminopimelate aminotransferase
LETLGSDVCAILLEPVQGEGGVHPLDGGWVKAVAKLCAERDWLLLFDEVQTGFGRCGDWFGYQHFGVQPDGFSFAKGIAGGFPMGGFLLGDKLNGTLTPGLHATTFGGGPLACAAALATLEILEGVIGDVGRKGQLLRDGLAGFETRGRGLMLGISVKGAPKAYIPRLLERGLVCLTAGADALRLLPPLTVSDSEIVEALAILKEVL